MNLDFIICLDVHLIIVSVFNLRRIIMNEQFKLFYNCLDTAKENVLSEAQALSSDGRTDESNSLKAKANIYDICKAVTGAAINQDPDAPLKYSFVEVFKRITAPWSKSLAAARAHDDARKIMIEEAKLSAVDEIFDKIDEMF